MINFFLTNMETKEYPNNQEQSSYEQFRKEAVALFGEKSIKEINKIDDSHFRFTVHITIDYKKLTVFDLYGRVVVQHKNERDITIDVKKIRNAMGMLGSPGQELWLAKIVDLPNQLSCEKFELGGSSSDDALNQLHAKIQEFSDIVINPELYKDL